MDEIEFKLASNNPILIAHGLSKILEAIKNEIKNGTNNDISKIKELKTLYSNCRSANAIVSSTACHALVSLVENELLDVSSTLLQLIAILGETKNFSATTAAICNLLVLELKLKNCSDDYLCPFSIKAPQHPLITALIQKKDAWRDIIGHMQSMLHCNAELIVKHVELLRPVFMYILCNPSMNLSESCRRETWHLLLKTEKTVHLQMEILQWLRVNDPNSCINTSNIILELSEKMVAEKNYELCMALAPLIMALAFDLLKHNLDPRPNFNMIRMILNSIDVFTEEFVLVNHIMVALLAEILLVTPTFCLIDVMKIAMFIFVKLQCCEVIAYSLLASILPWMAYATVLSADALDIGKDLIYKIKTESYRHDEFKNINPKRSRHVDIIRHANPNYQFYTEFCSFVQCMTDNDLIVWLKRLSDIPRDFLFKYKLILGGAFLFSNNSSIIVMTAKLLLKIAQSNKNFAGYVLSLLLHKVTNSYEIDVVKELLIILPELAVSKENVPIIVHTIETFVSAGDPLKYLAINLYLKAWVVEPRCHRYLFSALIDISKNDKTMKGNVACAKAMKFICEKRPEHGAELVPLLSHILNCCTDISGSAASAMALQGISALCLSGIADVCSTWKILSPKMNKEERPIVMRSICEFFGDIPSNPMHSEEEFDKLVDEALSKLWKLTCFEITRSMDTVEAAFKALSAYPLNKMTLSGLPEQFRNNLQLSQKYIQSSSETEQKIENILSYIPGTCWINMLENIYEPARPIAGNFIIKLINEELYYFRTGIYMWPLGEPINYKYLPEKSPARAVGEYLRRYKLQSTPEKQKVAMECLRIFANKYAKALPPIQWDLLNNVLQISDEAESYGITIACHQAAVSLSAKKFLSKYLAKVVVNNTEINEDEFKKCWHLCTHLEDICRGVMSNVLGPFLNSATNHIVDRAIMGRENYVTMFDQLMTQCSKSLKDDLVHHDNKTLITNILEKLLIRIDVKNRLFHSLVKAMLEMTTEHIERITMPSVWTKVTNEKLEKAVIIRAELAMKKDNEIPMSWMNEIIQASLITSGMHRCVLENIARIQSHLRHEKSNAMWCWDLMCRIQTTIIDAAENYSTDSVKFLCNILFVTVIILSCDNCLLTSDELIISSNDVRARLFPHAIMSIVSTQYWKDFTQQIMEWLNFMRTSPLPESYKIIFHNALISLKRDRYLDDQWMKYLSVRSSISL